jgi:hypothetical protein
VEIFLKEKLSRIKDTTTQAQNAKIPILYALLAKVRVTNIASMDNTQILGTYITGEEVKPNK